jgi:hypothetical protein
MKKSNPVALSSKVWLKKDWELSYAYVSRKSGQKEKKRSKLLGQVLDIRRTTKGTIGSETDIPILFVKTSQQDEKDLAYGLRVSNIDYSGLESVSHRELVAKKLTGAQLAGFQPALHVYN